jgi:hypothetical protein
MHDAPVEPIRAYASPTEWRKPSQTASGPNRAARMDISMLKNFKIRTKIISVVALLGLIAIGGLTYVVEEFRSADMVYSAS